jgi:hypothetical protein
MTIMDNKIIINTGKSLVAWSQKMKSIGMHNFAKKFATDSIYDFYILKKLGLPTYDSYIIPVSEFLNNFTAFRETFIHGKYYLVLIPISSNYQKYSLTGFENLSESVTFIKSKIRNLYSHYLIRISEFENNIYGGSIMCNESKIICELAKGLQTEIAYGTSNVFQGWFTDGDFCVQYNTDDESIRKLIWRAVRSICFDFNSISINEMGEYNMSVFRNYSFINGYFEFAFTQSDTKELRLIFFDIKLSQAYYQI